MDIHSSGAFLGGVITIWSSGIVVEHYKRHVDRNSVAAMLAAEIESLIVAVRDSDTEANFDKIRQSYEAGNDFQFPAVHYAEPATGLIFEKNIEKIGLMPPEIAGKVVLFYGYLTGVRASIKNLVTGAFDGREGAAKMKAATIAHGLNRWKAAEQIGDDLIVSLRTISTETWPKRIFRSVRLRGVAGK